MKNERQKKIIEIIRDRIIFTQDDLQKALNDIGICATQSTVSRDIKELRLIKGHDEQGNYRYILRAQDYADRQPVSHFHNLFASSVISVDCALNQVVVKCYNGMASSVCVAIDTLFKNDMLGSVAGDDTVLIITRSTESANDFVEKLKNLM